MQAGSRSEGSRPCILCQEKSSCQDSQASATERAARTHCNRGTRALTHSPLTPLRKVESHPASSSHNTAQQDAWRIASLPPSLQAKILSRWQQQQQQQEQQQRKTKKKTETNERTNKQTNKRTNAIKQVGCMGSVSVGCYLLVRMSSLHAWCCVLFCVLVFVVLCVLVLGTYLHLCVVRVCVVLACVALVCVVLLCFVLCALL